MSFPDLADEIERKSNATMVKLLNELNAGEISHTEFYYGIRSVWDTASGLISKELMDMLAGLTQQGPGDEPRVWIFSTDAFADSEELVVVKMSRRKDSVTSLFGSQHGVKIVEQEFPIEKYPNPRNEMKEYADSFLYQLRRVGKEL